jgi:hypothetical protein
MTTTLKNMNLFLAVFTAFFFIKCSNAPKETAITKENDTQTENSELSVNVSFYEAVDYKTAKEILFDIDAEHEEEIKYDYLANDSVKASWEIKQHPLTSKLLISEYPGIAGTGAQQSTSVFIAVVLVNDTNTINEYFPSKKHKNVKPFWIVTGGSATLALIKDKSKAFSKSALKALEYEDFSLYGFTQLVAVNNPTTTKDLKSYFGTKSPLITKINFNEQYEFILETSSEIYDFNKSFGRGNIDTKALNALNKKYGSFVKPYQQF